MPPRVRASPQSDSERVDEHLKGRRLLTPARAIQEEPRKRRAPVLEDADELAARDVFGRVLFRRESQSDAVQRGPEREIDSAASQITVEWARYPKHLEQMTGR